MPSLWGKEFLIFLNLMKYALILGVGVVFIAAFCRLVQKQCKKEDDNGKQK